MSYLKHIIFKAKCHQCNTIELTYWNAVSFTPVLFLLRHAKMSAVKKVSSSTYCGVHHVMNTDILLHKLIDTAVH